MVALSVEFISSVYHAFLRPDAARIDGVARQLLDGDRGAIYVATRADRIVGLIGMLLLDHPMAALTVATEVMWFMTPTERGGGMRLFRRGAQWARDQGADVLQMIAPAGEPVGALYRRLGFQEVETTFQRRLR